MSKLELKRIWEDMFPSGFSTMSFPAQVLVVIACTATYGPFIIGPLWLIWLAVRHG